MATSLQAQLNQLSQQRKLTSVAENSNQRPSILFTWKKAADLDKHAILQIGKQGFDELVSQQPKIFQQYSESLFSYNLQSLDRNLLSMEENHQINVVVDRYLRAVSPSFLLQSSLKSLEWLVRGFRINEMNVDTFIISILPFHETRQFIQALRVISINDSSPWKFLIPVRVSGVHLDRTLLVQELIKNPQLFIGLATAIDRSISEGIYNKPLISLFMVTAIEYVQRATKINDNILRPLLNSIFIWVGGLTDSASYSKGSGNNKYPAGLDLIAASQMIFSIICKKLPLNRETVIGFLSQAITPFKFVYGTSENEISSKVVEHFKFAYNKLSVKQLLEFTVLISRTQSIKTLNEEILTLLSNTIPKDVLSSELEDVCLEFNCATIFGHLGEPYIIPSDFEDSDVESIKNDDILDIEAETIGKSLSNISQFITNNKINTKSLSWYDYLISKATPTNAESNDIKAKKLIEKHFSLLSNRYVSNEILESVKNSATYDSVFTILRTNENSCKNDVDDLISKFITVGLCESTSSSGELSIETALLQFYLSQYLNSESSENTKVFALILTYNVLNSSKDSKDYQLLIVPLLTLCSSNGTLPERISAISLLREIHSRMSGLINVEKDKSGSDDFAVNTFGLDSFMGPKTTANIRFLPHIAASKLIQQIISREGDIIRNPEDLPEVMQNVVLTMKASGNKSNVKIGANGIGIRQDFLLFLISHIDALPSILSQINLINIMDEIEAGEKNKLLLPVLTSSISNLSTLSVKWKKLKRQNYALCSSIVDTFMKVTEPMFTSTKSGIKFLNASLNMAKCVGTEMDKHVEFLVNKSFVWLSKSFNSDIDELQKKKVFNFFFDIVSSGESRADAVLLAKQILSDVIIPEDIIKTQLSLSQLTSKTDDENEDSIEGNNRRKQKKAKVSSDVELNGNAVSKERTLSLKRIVSVLEIISHKPNIPIGRPLLVSLFSVLEFLITEDFFDTIVPLEYLKQLTLAAISNIITVADDIRHAKDDLNEVRVELLVQTFRNSEIPQTQTSILLLLSKFAQKNPIMILLNIMPIFTFMGAKVLRQDDNYNFHVIQQTLETLLPIFLTEKSTVQDYVAALSIFCDALPHIPKHRRIKLFTNIVSITNVERSLTILIRLLLTKGATKSFRVTSFRAQNTNGNNGSSNDLELMEFILTLARNFSFEYQLKAAKEISISVLNGKYYAVGKNNSVQPTLAQATSLLFTGSEFTVKDFARLKLVSAEYLMHTFSSKALKPDFDISYLEGSILSIVDLIVSALVNPRIVGDSTGRYTKAFRKFLTEALAKIHNRLTPGTYIKSISSLINATNVKGEEDGKSLVQITNERRLIRNKGLEILQRHVTSPKFTDKFNNISSEDVKEYFKTYAALIPILSMVLADFLALPRNEDPTKSGVEFGTSSILLESVQNSLIILTYFARGVIIRDQTISTLLEKSSDIVANVLIESNIRLKLAKSGVKHVGNPSILSSVYISSTICVGTFFNSLGIRMLPILPKVVDNAIPTILNEKLSQRQTIIKSIGSQEESSNNTKVSLSLLSSLQMLSAIVETNPTYMGPYCRELISIISVPLVGDDIINMSSNNLQKTGLNSFNNIVEELAINVIEKLNTEDLLNAVYSIWKYLPVSHLTFEERQKSYKKTSNKIISQFEDEFSMDIDDENDVLKLRYEAFVETFNNIIQDNKFIDETRISLLEIFGNIITSLNKESITKHHSTIFQFFLRIFDYRRAWFSVYADDEIVGNEKDAAIAAESGVISVETEGIQIFVRHVMKLSESLFKPKFYSLSDWAKKSYTNSATVANFEKKIALEIYARNETFFRIHCSMLTALQSLFSSYYSFTVPTVIKFLSSFINKETIKKNDETTLFDNAINTLYCEPSKRPYFTRTIIDDSLWKTIMKSLNLWLTIEKDTPTGTLTELVFDNVVEPLINQIDCITLAAVSKSEMLMNNKEIKRKQRDILVIEASEKTAAVLTEDYVPVVGLLALAVGKEVAWRTVNSRLLQTTRNETRSIRLVALKSMKYLYERLGDNMLVIFPESIPFIAELLEDTDEEVEAECKAVCDVIQNYIEEPIYNYFSA